MIRNLKRILQRLSFDASAMGRLFTIGPEEGHDAPGVLALICGDSHVTHGILVFCARDGMLSETGTLPPRIPFLRRKNRTCWCGVEGSFGPASPGRKDIAPCLYQPATSGICGRFELPEFVAGSAIAACNGRHMTLSQHGGGPVPAFRSWL